MDDEENAKRERLTNIAQMLFKRQWNNISTDEQKALGLHPEDLPFIFITLDQIKNKVSFSLSKYVSLLYCLRWPNQKVKHHNQIHL